MALFLGVLGIMATTSSGTDYDGAVLSETWNLRGRSSSFVYVALRCRAYRISLSERLLEAGVSLSRQSFAGLSRSGDVHGSCHVEDSDDRSFSPMAARLPPKFRPRWQL